jgi:hypothetical protein
MTYTKHRMLLLFLTGSFFVWCHPTGVVAQSSDPAGRARGILRRIAKASESSLVRPTVVIDHSDGIAHFSFLERTITIDPALFDVADKFPESGDAMLAYVIGHEFAHYVRGHDFTYRLNHKYGAMLEHAGDKLDGAESLSLVRQGEYEADYYGLYYAYLAGYKYSPRDLRSFMDSMKEKFQTSDWDPTHPSWSTRKELVDTVLAEIDKMAFVHHAAVGLLLHGHYQMAAQMFEWIGSTVPIPEVQWNEFLCRALQIQEQIGATFINSSDLLQHANLKPLFRSGESTSHPVNRSAAKVNLDKCESILDLLGAKGFDAKKIDIGMALARTSASLIDCSECTGTSICTKHKDAVGLIHAKTDVTAARAGHSSQTSTAVESMIEPTKKKIAALKRYLKPTTVEVDKFTVRLYVNKDRTKISGGIDVESSDSESVSMVMSFEPCSECVAGVPDVFASTVYVPLDGQRLVYSFK